MRLWLTAQQDSLVRKLGRSQLHQIHLAVVQICYKLLTINIYIEREVGVCVNIYSLSSSRPLKSLSAHYQNSDHGDFFDRKLDTIHKGN